MKNYTEFLNERKRHKLTSKDNQELNDFLHHVLNNMDEEPNLLRSAYARIQGILKEIRSGNCPKDKLKDFFYTIFQFVEGKRKANDVQAWSEHLMELDIDSYDTLLSIIHEYNHLVHKFKNPIDFKNPSFNIRAWLFEPETMRPVTESSEEDDELQKLFVSQDLSWEEQQKLKHKLPRITAHEIGDDERDWKVGDIAFVDGRHLLVVESYEDYCDFGCGHIATYLAENPDVDEDEFGEYVCQHNKADRDMGELQDVCEEEIERLGKEFKKSLKESVNESKEDDFYQSTLDDEYHKEISKKYPDYNSSQSEEAADYIVREMKKKYPDQDWKKIEKSIRQKVFDGIT